MKKLFLILTVIFSMAYLGYGQGELSVDATKMYETGSIVDGDVHHFNGYFDGYFTLSADAWIIRDDPYGGTYAWARSKVTRYGYTQKEVTQTNNEDWRYNGNFDDYDGEIDYVYVDVHITVAEYGDCADADATVKWW